MKMVKKYSLAFLILVSITTSYGQQTDNWYFGSAAGFANTGLRVSFSTGSPVVSTCYPLMTEEGSSSVSDSITGAPLFYTDGVSVWDGTTNALATGGTGLLGHSSTTQSAIVMPVRGLGKWLIFTSGVLGGGLNYYTVTGSPGAFTVSVAINLIGGGIVGEGVTIIGSTKGGTSAYWVVMRDQGSTGQVRAWEVSTTGVVTAAPVLSTMSNAVGYAHTSFTSHIGTVKANTCQNKLAFTYLNANVDITGFNTATGSVIANTAKNIPVLSGGGNSGSYGIEFSPNDKYLYISNLAGSTVYQYDITANAIASMGTLSGESGQMQLGPDGVIYMAHNNVSPSAPPSYLSTITNPDLAGATFTPNALLLTGVTCGGNTGFSYRGLPTFPKSLSVTNPVILKPDTTICQGATITFGALYAGSIGAGATDYQWTFLDPATTTSTSHTPSHTYSNIGGPFKAKLYITDVCGRVWKDSMNITVVAPTNPTGSVSCSSNSVTLTGTGGATNYAWYDNNGNFVGAGSPLTLFYDANHAPPSFTVKDASSFTVNSSGSSSIGPTAASLNWAGNTPSGYAVPGINILASVLTLKSFQINPYNSGGSNCNNFTFDVEIKNGAGTVVYLNSFNSGTLTCNNPFTVNINATLPKGNNYTITLKNFAGNISLLYGGTWAGGTNANQITFPTVGGAGTFSIANVQYDYKNYTVTLNCSNPGTVTRACTLPVELSYFEATKNNEKISLNWITASERNNAFFDVERSNDGISWSVIGKINGSGNSSSLVFYDFTDNQPLSGTNYYRLVQYDINGEKNASEVREIDMSAKESVKVYPNPSTNQFNVAIPSSLAGAVITVTDILGREIYRRNIEQAVELSLGAEWPHGQYVLHWTSGVNAGTTLLMRE